MARQQEALAWRIGGPQGSGVDTAAGMFARACAIGGLHLFGRREYYWNMIRLISAKRWPRAFRAARKLSI